MQCGFELMLYSMFYRIGIFDEPVFYVNIIMILNIVYPLNVKAFEGYWGTILCIICNYSSGKMCLFFLLHLFKHM